jgi:threonine dehydratase
VDSPWPITWDDVLAARDRIARHLQPTPLRHYQALDDEVGSGIRVLVKHENHLPTNAFKVRNAVSLLTALTDDERARGVIAASRGNHGQGLAWAGQALGVPVTICVPVGNNPEKNAAMRGLGAEVRELGRDYDACIEIAARLAAERGQVVAHSTNDPRIIAGAATMAAEIVEQAEQLDAVVVSVGGGSQAVGALVAARARRPGVAVYAVQAAGASAMHDAWHAGRPIHHERCDTFADGLATRSTYALTFPALREGLADFITVGEAAIAEAVRMLLRTTHNLAEGAGAAGLAGLLALRERLAGRTVAIAISGANIDEPTLRRVLNREL